MDYRILGSLEVASNGANPQLGPPKQRAVLAILLLRANQIVSTDLLVELVWGERQPRTASHSIQIYVSELRKALEPLAGGPVILTRAPGYLLDADPASIDSVRFERLATRGTRELGSGDIEVGLATLRSALTLWRGSPLSDFSYEEFARDDIHRLRELRLAAVEELAAGELRAGHSAEALSLIEGAIREEPLRDRLRELQMQALYGSGRQADALRAYEAYRSRLAEELGLDPSPPLRRLQERILLHDTALLPPERSEAKAEETTEALRSARNPYKGLRAFGEPDAGDFFGREKVVESLIEALGSGTRLLALVGPSGCGKSSLLAAGLIHALRKGAVPGSTEWVIAQVVPGRHPLDETNAALFRAVSRPLADSTESKPDDALLLRAADRLLPPDRRLLLVIDQFEELFTVVDEEERELFLHNLVAAATDHGARVSLVISLRADFYDRPLMHAQFAEIFVPGVFTITPMAPGDLEEAVTKPATLVGVDVDSALRAELVAATVDRSGALPLLQYVLTELFDHSTERRLTLEGYRTLGGLERALSRSAEELYARLDPESQPVAMQVLLRLVWLGRGEQSSRRRVPVGELADLDIDPVVLANVLSTFGDGRLLTFDRDPVTGDPTVEVAHEALLSEWGRLANWIEAHRAAIRRHESLAAAAEEWETSGRNPDFLLAGTRLSEHEAAGEDGALRLTASEQAFLTAGLQRRRIALEEEAARKERQRRLERRAETRLVALVVAIALIAAGATFGFFALGANRPDAVLLYEGNGDQGFSGLESAGFQQGASKFGLRVQEVTGVTFSMGAQADQLSDQGIPLIVVGSSCDAFLNQVAQEHPDQRYAALDCNGAQPNVSYFSTADEQGSFLVGAAAALKSTTGIIGFIGGVDFPTVWRFEAGYEAGARAVNPAIRVRPVYLTEPPYFDGFSAPTLAYRAATKLYARGADVIFHAAGFSGIGLFEAAKAASERQGKHLWAIGVDSDQHATLGNLGWPHVKSLEPYVLTSMLKRVNTEVYDALAAYARGTLAPGSHELGLAQGGVDISYSGHFIDDIRPQIDALRADIIACRIRVPVIPAGKSAPTGAPTQLAPCTPPHDA